MPTDRDSHAPHDSADVVYEVPSLLKRSVVYLVALLVLSALAALYFVEVPVVVTGRGRVTPQGDVVLVQTRTGGVVNAVLAGPGDRLPAGAPIVKLDLADSDATVADLEQRVTLQREQLERLDATLELISRILANPADTGRGGTDARPLATVGNVMQLINQVENAQAAVEGAEGAVKSWPSRSAAMTRDIELTRENIRVNDNSHASQQRLLASAEPALEQRRTQLEGFRSLAERRLISSLELALEEEKVRTAEAAAAEARRRYEQLAVDISNQRIKLADLEGRLKGEPAAREGAVRQARGALRQTLGLLGQERQNMATERRELDATLAATQARLDLARRDVSLTAVSMPVPGMIAEMKVASAGELVDAGAVVAVVVPDGVTLLVEAEVPNRDIGFVRPGIEGRIKVDAYPFRQFGTLPARVHSVLPGLGDRSNFLVRLELLRAAIAAPEGPLPIFPGLTVEVELLTARRQLLGLLLDRIAGAAVEGQAR